MKALVLVVTLLIAAGVSAAENPEKLVSFAMFFDHIFSFLYWWSLLGFWFCVMWSWVVTNNKREWNDY